MIRTWWWNIAFVMLSVLFNYIPPPYPYIVDMASICYLDNGWVRVVIQSYVVRQWPRTFQLDCLIWFIYLITKFVLKPFALTAAASTADVGAVLFILPRKVNPDCMDACIWIAYLWNWNASMWLTLAALIFRLKSFKVWSLNEPLCSSTCLQFVC